MKLTDILTENELLDRERQRQLQTTEVPDEAPGGWNVMILNDDITPFQVVVEAVAKGTGMSEGEAFHIMRRAHQGGWSPVKAYASRDLAETVADAIMTSARTNDQHDDKRRATNGGRGWTGPWPLQAEVMKAGE
jgi:ATP-dependent Clp protease adapter protein ClpS